MGRLKGLLRTPSFSYGLLIVLTFFLFSGQGIRYLVGLPAYVAIAFALVLLSSWSFVPKSPRGRIPLLLVAFIVMASVSLLWSQTPLITVAALVILLATTLVALLATFSFEPRRLMGGLYRGLQLSLVIGILFELFAALVVRGPINPLFHEWLAFVDSSAISPSVLQWTNGTLFVGGPIQGFVGNRNLFGFIALLAAILAPLLYREGSIKILDAIATVILAIFVHMYTGSATVTFIAVAVGILTLAAYIIRGAPEHRRRMLSWLFGSLAVVAAFISYVNRDVVTLMLGREPDLTNRTEIWRAVFDKILEYPQGTGWVSYWPVWQAPYKDMVTLGGTPVAQAHNAFLDVWLQIGPLAAIVLLALFFVTLISGWELVESETHGDTVVPLMWVLLTVALALQGISESRLLLEGNWFLFVVLVSSVPQLISNSGHLRAKERLSLE